MKQFLLALGIIAGIFIIILIIKNWNRIVGNGNPQARSWCRGWDDCPATHHCNANTGKCDPPSSRYTEQVFVPVKPDVKPTDGRPSTAQNAMASISAGFTPKK